MADREIGHRLAYWRKRRGMTRQRFADLVGRSASWVYKVEHGERDLVRLPMLERVASALQIDVQALTDDAAAHQARQCPDAAEVAAIKAALGRYEAIGRRPQDRPHPDLARLRRQVEYACAAFLASHFSVLGQTLPGLILDGQRAVEALRGDEVSNREAARLLVMTYKLASSTLHKFASTEIAWLAADRAVVAAQTAGDPISAARATRCVARAMMAVGQPREAVDLLAGAAERMESDLGNAGPEFASIYGMLLLAAEIAAARCGDADTALTMHGQATAVVKRLRNNHHDRVTAFGGTNVALHRLAALVRLGEGPAAVNLAKTLDRTAVAQLPRERKANFFLDLAQAHRQCGHPDRAISALWAADQTAPQEVRCRPLIRDMISDLWETQTGKPSPYLRQLARNAGLPM